MKTLKHFVPVLCLFISCHCFSQQIIPLPNANSPQAAYIDIATADNEVYRLGQKSSQGNARLYLISKFDGITWTDVDTFTLDGFHNSARALYWHRDTLYIGGNFFRFKGITGANQIVGYANGNYFPIGTGLETDTISMYTNHIVAITKYQDKLMVGGQLSIHGGTQFHPLAQWTGNSWINFGPALTNPDCLIGTTVSAFTVYSNRLYVRGDFVYAGNLYANLLAYYENGSYHAIGSSMPQYDVLDAFRRPATFLGNEIFNVQQDTGAIWRVTKWDGNQWTNVFTVPGPDQFIHDIFPFGNKLLIAGSQHLSGGNLDAIVTYSNGTIEHPFSFALHSEIYRFFNFRGTTYFIGNYSFTGSNNYYEFGKLENTSDVPVVGNETNVQVYPNPCEK